MSIEHPTLTGCRSVDGAASVADRWNSSSTSLHALMPAVAIWVQTSDFRQQNQTNIQTFDKRVNLCVLTLSSTSSTARTIQLVSSSHRVFVSRATRLVATQQLLPRQSMLRTRRQSFVFLKSFFFSWWIKRTKRTTIHQQMFLVVVVVFFFMLNIVEIIFFTCEAKYNNASRPSTP